jgi:Trypsin-like peptidase domain
MTMTWPALLLTIALSLVLFFPSQTATARPDINNLKKAVVRVKNTKFGDVGTGVIVRVIDEHAYIVTAAHIVRGDEHPEVALFTQQEEPLRASLIDREYDNQKGLALLRLKTNKSTLAGLRALSLGNSFGLQGGEEVMFIGFPEGTSIWTVTAGSVARLEGRTLVFSGTVSGGNSGGPMLLGDRMIGLVTDLGPSLGYAVQAESVALYIRGVKRELINPNGMPGKTELVSAFCQALSKLSSASDEGFESIKGKPSSSTDRHFYPTLYLPGSSSGRGWVVANERAYYYLLIGKDKREVEVEYARIGYEVRRCFPAWEEKEEQRGDLYHKFREGEKGKLVSLDYNPKPQNNGTYYLTLSMYPPGNTEW